MAAKLAGEFIGGRKERLTNTPQSDAFGSHLGMAQPHFHDHAYGVITIPANGSTASWQLNSWQQDNRPSRLACLQISMSLPYLFQRIGSAYGNLNRSLGNHVEKFACIGKEGGTARCIRH